MISTGVFHFQGDTTDSENLNLWIEFGEDSPEDVIAALRNMISTAVSNGLRPEDSARLEKLVFSIRDIFRIELGKMTARHLSSPWKS